MSKKFKPLYGLCAPLGCDLAARDPAARLPCAEAHDVCIQLGSDYYSYGIITNGISHEEVKIMCVAGAVVLDRDISNSRAWDACDKLKFEWTPEAMAAVVKEAEAAAGVDTDVVCDIVSESLEVTPDSTCGETCVKRIELKSCASFEPFIVGDQQYTMEQGCIKAENAPAGKVLADGVFENATVTVSGGRIIDVRAGTPIVKNSCSPCCE